MSLEILLASFNGEKYLGEQIRSFVSSSPNYFFLRISDDASDDSSVQTAWEVCLGKQKKSLDEQQSFSFSISQDLGCQNLGITQNFNTLLHQSLAEYIFFSDQDDVWLSHKIEISLKKMQDLEAQYGQNTPILVHTDLTVVDQNLNLIHPSFRQYQNLDPYPAKLLPRLLVQNFVTGCTMLINQPLKQLVTPIPEQAIMHDWWIALTAAAFGKIAYIPEPTVLYRQHQQNSIGARKWNLSYILSRLNNTEKIRNDIQKTITQAQKFRATFQEQLSPEQLDTIDTYINLPNQPWPTRKYLMIKKGYYQLGKLKNLGFFYCI